MGVAGCQIEKSSLVSLKVSKKVSLVCREYSVCLLTYVTCFAKFLKNDLALTFNMTAPIEPNLNDVTPLAVTNIDQIQ